MNSNSLRALYILVDRQLLHIAQPKSTLCVPQKPISIKSIRASQLFAPQLLQSNCGRVALQMLYYIVEFHQPPLYNTQSKFKPIEIQRIVHICRQLFNAIEGMCKQSHVDLSRTCHSIFTTIRICTRRNGPNPHPVWYIRTPGRALAGRILSSKTKRPRAR